MMGDRTYLDHAATTPLDPRVLEAMSPYYRDRHGNPSSTHFYGQVAEAAVDEARLTISEILDCDPMEIIFTSCGSESDNLALRGAALAERERREANHVLISSIEHPAVDKTARQLAELFGFELEFLPVDEFGTVQPEVLEDHIRSDTAVVSIMYASNEVGTINPIPELGAICRQRGVRFHTDAVQAASQLPVRVDELRVDLLSLGAHKFYGPKGMGALYIRRGTALFPVQTGGAQEFGLRAGTLNVPYIVGMAAALKITHDQRDAWNSHYLPLRDELLRTIPSAVPSVRVTGHPSHRLPNHASFTFQHVDGNELVTALDLEGFACSSGSACKTGDPKPSPSLQAMGFSNDWALGSLRVTVGRSTTQAEVRGLIHALPPVISRLRGDDVR